MRGYRLLPIRTPNGRTLDVTNVVWAAGYESVLGLIALPLFEETGEPRDEGRVVTGEPDLCFVRQHFQYAFSSTMIHGVMPCQE
jgi:hypothetical protein